MYEEQQPEQPQPENFEPRTFIVPAEDYQLLAAELDERTLRAGFIGRWASRGAFGLALLEDSSASQRLARLPDWLRPHVRLDGDSFAAEHEQAGVFVITPVTTGVCVFDAAVVRRRK